MGKEAALLVGSVDVERYSNEGAQIFEGSGAIVVVIPRRGATIFEVLAAVSTVIAETCHLAGGDTHAFFQSCAEAARLADASEKAEGN